MFKLLLELQVCRDTVIIFNSFMMVHAIAFTYLVGDVSEEFGTYLFGKDRTNKLTVEKFQTFHDELTLAVLKLEVS